MNDEMTARQRPLERMVRQHTGGFQPEATGEGVPQQLPVTGVEIVTSASGQGIVNNFYEMQHRIAELEAVLLDIGNYAHDRSTGPAVPDDLWEIRRMAYDA